MSALPKFTMRQLLDAGVHFGHKTMRWNPRMEPYIFGVRDDIHIIDLQQTVPLLHKALSAARDAAANNGRVLFVGTKTQASEIIAETARRCGQYYVNHRWMGGTLTNWGTVSKSIKTLRNLEAQLNDEEINLSKKERLKIQRQLTKLELSLGGIKDMGGVPDVLFVIDTNKEAIAIKEANKLGIPVIAIADSNSNPDGIDHIIPGNDDATRSIKLYCNLVSDAVLSGIQATVKKSDKDIGASKDAPQEKLPPVAKKKAKIEKKAEDEKKEEGKKESAAPEKKAEAKKKSKPVVKQSSGKKPAAKKPADKKSSK